MRESEVTTMMQARTGIFSVKQAAELLGVESLAVQRLIGLGLLADNRNAKESVVFAADLERYIGQGSPSLSDMPAIRNGWFRGDEWFVERPSFIQQMKNASEGIADVRNTGLISAYNRNCHAKKIHFGVQPTSEMIKRFRSPVERTAAYAFSGRELPSYTLGQSAIAAELRSVAARLLDRKRNGMAGEGRLKSLYRTREGFLDVTGRAAERIQSSLSIDFSDNRSLDLGRSATIERTIVRSVSLESLSPNLNADIDRAMELAF